MVRLVKREKEGKNKRNNHGNSFLLAKIVILREREGGKKSS
jgi:hypothetical protein